VANTTLADNRAANAPLTAGPTFKPKQEAAVAGGLGPLSATETEVKTTNPSDYLQLLTVFRMGLLHGFISPKEVTAWADAIIEHDEQPDYFTIELSLGGQDKSEKQLSLLNEFIGQHAPPISGRIILGLLYQKYSSGQLPLQKVVRTMYWLHREADFTDLEKSFIYGLDDDYDLAVSNTWGSLKQVEDSVMEFLDVYKDFRLDNAHQWKELENTTEPKLQALLQEELRQAAINNQKRGNK
jgi:hypothetical protein